MIFRVINHRGKVATERSSYEDKNDDLFLQRLRIDSYQHPFTGEPITSKQRAEYLEYYRGVIDAE